MSGKTETRRQAQTQMHKGACFFCFSEEHRHTITTAKLTGNNGGSNCLPDLGKHHHVRPATPLCPHKASNCHEYVEW